MTVCYAQLGGAAPLPEIKKSTGPSLEETTKWITEKFASLPPAKYYIVPFDRKNFYVASFDDCGMTITDDKDGSLQTSYVQLSEMDASKISVFKYETASRLSIYSLGGLNAIKVLGLSNVTLKDKDIRDRFTVKNDAVGPKGQNFLFTMSGKQISMNRASRNWLDIYFKEDEVAESMSNAFKHAIKLCQQKVADDKAAQPPKKKELF